MKKIIHMDLDAFFAAVEQLDHPELRGKPVIVGGTSDRGVVSTASYEARKYGIHSAMPIFRAKKLCPNGHFVSGSYARYQDLSKQVFNILGRYTDAIQQVSIDEAYMDVTGTQSAFELARAMQHAIVMETGLTASFGVSYNKFLAKLASDWNKPNGIKVITPDMVPDCLLPLNIIKVHGLGKKSVQRLNAIGVYTIADLMLYDEDFLSEYIGGFGHDVYWRIRGVDNREIKEEGQRKSIGKETTFKEDIEDLGVLESHLDRLSEKISGYLSKKGFVAQTVTLKFKTKDFENHTRSKTVYHHVATQADIFTLGKELLHQTPLGKPIRLIGLSVSNLTPIDQVQLSLFDGLEH